MIIACPRCELRHDVSQRQAGEVFACKCGNVRFQYQVRVEGGGLDSRASRPQTAIITAKGDLQGNGKVSEYKVVVPSDGSIGPLEEIPAAERY